LIGPVPVLAVDVAEPKTGAGYPQFERLSLLAD
jgi:hypothetical protein